MDERELRRQVMAPDVYPSAEAEGGQAKTLHAVALAAILTAPVWLAVVL